jgi:hypothetical protein
VTNTVYVVCEGEQIHGGYIPHLVSSDEWSAVTYARDLRAALDGKRFPNVYVYAGELDVVGLTPMDFEETE